ncbi:MAG: carbamoyl phosphate synthase large subunit [Elusimicrobia bacterium RIFCSPLOWO2_01_FULL_54_10]|nr:MAG: carbamoyl phosphate synthase large subunit [Elusimicrobia bacterium RIFCSPLOWO2_01_FULL_54_10]
MPKRTDLKKIMIIGSGPIVIGQACEFDYSGSQAVKALRAEGYKVILINSNPATIMTDPEIADATYIEPLTPEFAERVIAKERPDAILPTLGGQTALNLAVALHEKGILEKYKVELIGAKIDAIHKAEDRKLFKQAMIKAGLEVPKSGIAFNIGEAQEISTTIGFPLILRPSFTLGGTGSAIVYTQEDFFDAATRALECSPISEILIEESVLGWKEFELEVMRDTADNCVVICSIENFDPMGVHTGDSITVAPIQTLTDKEYQRLRDQAFICIRTIGVETGGSNIQFAVNPKNGRSVVIEMNPRVSRSSALASKATGFPIAKIAAKLAVGYRLDEISNDITQKTPACFEPTLDYTVVKVPRFAFEKFTNTDQTLNSQMKSVGEVMAIGRTFNEALQKAIRGLEIGRDGLGGDGKMIAETLGSKPNTSGEFHDLLEEFKKKLMIPNCDRVFNVKNALQLGMSVQEISEISSIDPWFIRQIKEILDMGNEIRKKGFPVQKDLLKKAKQNGFSDKQIAYFTKKKESDVRSLRKKLGIIPTYKVVDTCAGEFPAFTPYFYSTYEDEDEAVPDPGKKVIILGGGPNRIGQGIEFDYCCVHAVQSLHQAGYKSIMVNCNPETVSTDYDISDRLYFEPLTFEDVMSIIEKEKPLGVIVQFGGQTPLNLTGPLSRAGVKILGTSPRSIDLSEDREKFGKFLKTLKINHPDCGTARSVLEAKKIASKIGYPVMVRPSYVLGGRGMKIVYNEAMLMEYLERADDVSMILIDKFLDEAKEVDVDALSDGETVFIGGIMEHIEEAGIHSGDSACILPPQTLAEKEIKEIRRVTGILALKLKVKGLLNIQFAVKDGKIYVLEVNPRASRTIPFVSKSTGVPLAKLAARLMVGEKLKNIVPKVFPQPFVAVKEAVLPWDRFPGADVRLSPEMRSTGEVMGMDINFPLAFFKSQLAAGSSMPLEGSILFSLTNADKKKALPIARELVSLGFSIQATDGTHSFFEENGLSSESVKKISQGRPHVVDLIKNRQVQIVVNTPSQSSSSEGDGYEIRQAALKYRLPIFTTVSSLNAFKESILQLKKKGSDFSVNSLQEVFRKN